MREKKTFYTEMAFFMGILFLALGTAFMERADFGMSMVVAPAYVIYIKVAQFFPFFTFGMSEYILQAVLILLLSFMMRKFKISYLFSFVTAVIYGFTLDLLMAAVKYLPFYNMGGRLFYFVAGMVICALGVSLLFHTYLAPEAYELMVKEFSAKSGQEISKVKTIYDITSCMIAIILSFIFFGFGHFEGVKAGTIICAVCNGWLIGKCGKLLERSFEFKDAAAFRK